MKHIKILGILFAMGLLVCTACEKDSKEKVILTKDTKPEKVLEIVNEQYGRQSRRGSNITYKYTFMDESTQEGKEKNSFDVEKGVLQAVYKEGEEPETRRFITKEDETSYSYERDAQSGEWIRYIQEEDEEGKTTYQYQEEGQLFVYDEEHGYVDVAYSNEGEEELDGEDTIKIRITGKEKTEEEESTTVTKESILEEYGLEESSIESIEGLSEALDRYVDAINNSAGDNAMNFETYLWADPNSGLPLKIHTMMETGEESGEKTAEQMREFEDNIWKAYILEEEIGNGSSLEEALAAVKEQEPQMEAENEAEREALEEESAGASEEDMIQKSVEITEHKVYGNECEKIEELPKNYTEVTQEEYFSGEY